MQNFNKAENLELKNGPSLVGSMEQVGQLGLGIKPGALDGATPLVLPPAIVYVTHLPSMWNNPRDGALARVVKSLFETHAKSVSGVEIGYTMEYGQQPVGHDGQQMDAPTVSKRTAVQPSFTYPEVTGNLCFRCHQQWIWDMADPDTQISFARLDANQIPPYTMSAYSASLIVLQFDQTYAAHRLLGALYVCNVMPQGTGEFGVKREIGQANVVDRAITYTGLGIENASIYNLGKTIAAGLALRQGTFLNPTDPYGDGLGEPDMYTDNGFHGDSFSGFARAPGNAWAGKSGPSTISGADGTENV